MNVGDTMLFIPGRHTPITEVKWSKELARNYIISLINKTESLFQAERLWPVHPDLQECNGISQPITSLWFGAAGTLWALNQLNKSYPVNLQCYMPYLEQLTLLQSAWIKEMASQFIPTNSTGFLLGSLGSNFVKWIYTGEHLEQLHQDAISNLNHPAIELMWGAPGSMIVALEMFKRNQQQEWLNIYQMGVTNLLSNFYQDDAKQCYVWQQDLYGSKAIYLGLVHGFAGNAYALLKGHKYSPLDKSIIEHLNTTFIKSAIQTADHANWDPYLEKPATFTLQNSLLHVCHGAPAMILGLAELWHLGTAETRDLFVKAGQLIWDAGPLEKPWGLCHGTAGNGYALLKLFSLTQDELWLDRAKKFAMHAIIQSQQAEAEYKQIRTDAWCGDMGLALFLRSCLRLDADFPMLDYL